MAKYKEVILLNDAQATGAGDSVVLGHQDATVAVSGTFVGTVKIQGNLGGNWYDLAVVNVTTLESGDSISASGLYAVAGVEGCAEIRANVTSYTSGAISVIGRLSF